MKKLSVLVAAISSLVIGGLLWAQGGPPGKGPGGGFQMTPKRQLSGMFNNLAHLEKKPLNKDQAVKVLAVVNPWKAKAKMTDEDAKDLQKKLKPIPTADQLNEIEVIAQTARQQFGGGKGGPGGGGGGKGDAGKGGGPGKGGFDEAAKAKMQKYRDKHRDDNPLNVKQIEAGMKEFEKEFPEMAGRGGGTGRRLMRMKESWANLEKLAKGGAPAAVKADAKAGEKKAAAARKPGSKATP